MNTEIAISGSNLAAAETVLASGGAQRQALHALVEVTGWQDHTLRRPLTADERRLLAANAEACRALLAPASHAEAAAVISALLIAFVARPSDSEASVLVNAYLEAIGSAPLWAINAVRANFLAGRVEKQSRTFPPKPPEFVAELNRVLLPARLAKHQIDAIRIAKPPRTTTPEQRAANAARLRAIIGPTASEVAA